MIVLRSDGKFVDDETLTHSSSRGHKYIDRYWKNGKWNYTYPGDTQAKNVVGVGNNLKRKVDRYANHETKNEKYYDKNTQKVLKNIRKSNGGKTTYGVNNKAMTKREFIDYIKRGEEDNVDYKIRKTIGGGKDKVKKTYNKGMNKIEKGKKKVDKFLNKTKGVNKLKGKKKVNKSFNKTKDINKLKGKKKTNNINTLKSTKKNISDRAKTKSRYIPKKRQTIRNVRKKVLRNAYRKIYGY